MIQIIPKIDAIIGFGEDGPALTSVNDGIRGLFVGGMSDPPRIPNPNNATYRNLIIFSRDPTRVLDITCMLVVDEVDTALVVTLPVGQNVAIISGVDVNVLQFQDIAYKWTLSGAAGFPGYSVSAYIEREGDGNFFGITGSSGTPAAVNLGYIGGGFGNGGFEDFDFNAPTISPSNTRSICATPGSVTGIVMKSHMGNVGAGATFTAYVVKDNVLQDGSPGTVNSAVVMTAGTSQVFGSFNVPFDKGDRCDIAVVRTGVAGNGGGQVSVGILFEPTNAGYFMLCGGSGDPIAQPLFFKWTASAGATTELINLAPIGTNIILARGLYVSRGTRAIPSINGPGAGKSWTHTLMQGSTLNTDPVVPTACVVQLVDLEGEGFIEGLSILFGADSTATLKVEATEGASSAGFYWGLEASVFIAPATGNLQVNKIVNPSSSSQSFNFTASGGTIAPTTFALTHGQSQLYIGLALGTYGIEETVPAGWTASYNVSNGNPPSAINIEEDETVVVTVTNTLNPVTASGLYKLEPGKRNDTLWVDTNARTTRDVKKPNPFVKTAVVGE
jgi:hypothetical protein